MFFGMKAVENLSGLREKVPSPLPNPARTIAQHHLTLRFSETAATGLALYARDKVREVGAGIQSRGAFNGGRIGDRSRVAHRFAFRIARFCRPDGDQLGFPGFGRAVGLLAGAIATSWVRMGTPVPSMPRYMVGTTS